MASTNSWDYMWPTFEQDDFKIIRHDFRGQMKSDKPAGPYSFALHAEDAKKLFDHLDVENVHIIGTSYGGEVAMKFAMMYPEMTKSISIIDSVSELDEVLKGFLEWMDDSFGIERWRKILPGHGAEHLRQSLLYREQGKAGRKSESICIRG